jgi:hypothetical protein
MLNIYYGTFLYISTFNIILFVWRKCHDFRIFFFYKHKCAKIITNERLVYKYRFTTTIWYWKLSKILIGIALSYTTIRKHLCSLDVLYWQMIRVAPCTNVSRQNKVGISRVITYFIVYFFYYESRNIKKCSIIYI